MTTAAKRGVIGAAAFVGLVTLFFAWLDAWAEKEAQKRDELEREQRTALAS